jgi:uncharacterized protein YfiM (DUF2279 family)
VAIFRVVAAPHPRPFQYALLALAVSVPCAAQVPEDSWTDPDKPLHAFAGAWTAGASYAYGVEREWSPADRRRAAAGVALGVAVAKEAYDRWTQDERFSFKDLAAGVAGAAAVLALTAAADR